MQASILIDWPIVEEFLEAIGRSTGPIVFAAYPLDASKPYLHIKADAEDTSHIILELIDREIEASAKS